MRVRSRRERWVIHGLLAAAVLLVAVSLGTTVGRDLFRSVAPRAETQSATSAEAVSLANKSDSPLPELDPPAAADSFAPAGSVVAPLHTYKPAPQIVSESLRAALAQKVGGLWMISVPSDGYTHRPSVVLEQQGAEVSGTYTADGGQTAKVEQARLSGNKLSFYVAHEQQGKPMKCWFEGTLIGDAWSGEVNFELGGGKGRLKFEARRETGRIAENALKRGAKPATTSSQEPGSGSSPPASPPPAESPANKNVDPFPAGSVWADDDSSRTLTVLERKGETFRGKLVVGDALERTFTGTVKEGKVSWLAKDVEAAKGGRGGDNMGKIQGDRIDFEYSTGAGKREFTLWRKNSKIASPLSAQRQTAKSASKSKKASSRKDSKSANSPSAALVTVDFHKPVKNVKSMSGFLHAINATLPSDDIIEPLRPALWRIFPGSKPHERLAKMKVPLSLVLSDTWGYQNQTPFQDYEAWEKHVRHIARSVAKIESARDKDAGVVWDIWNEPDHRDFWKGTFEEFLETFVRAAKVLREELGSETQISGPSITNYNVPQLTQFLDHCRSQNVKIDVLSWHELGVDADIPSVTNHLHDAQKRFLQNRSYASLGLKRFHANEIVGPGTTYQPAEILGYIKALELGGADGACKACWKDSAGRSTCSTPTLDGLLTPDKYEPRAAWWAYKHYADSVATRVHSASSDIRIPAFASRGDETAKEAPARLLMAYYAWRNSPNVRAARLRFQGLKEIPAFAKSKQVRVRIEQIPNSGEQPVSQLKTVAEDTLSVANGVAETRPFDLVLHEAYVVTLSPK